MQVSAVPSKDNRPRSAIQCPQSPIYLYGVLQTTGVSLQDVAVATGHAGIAGTTLSNFLCLAYHCGIAGQTPTTSSRSSAVPQAQ